MTNSSKKRGDLKNKEQKPLENVNYRVCDVSQTVSESIICK